MDISKLGPVLSFVGIFGGGLFWFLACIYRYDYLGGGYFGKPVFSMEAIWAIDPIFVVLAILPGLILFFIGFLLAISPIIRNQDEYTYLIENHITPQDRAWLNLFYIGETFLLVTTIMGLMIFFQGFASSVEIIIPTVISAFVTMICILNYLTSLYYILEGEADNMNVTWVVRNTILFLGIGLVSLAYFVVPLNLDSWSFIGTTTSLMLLSGILAIIFLIPRMKIEGEDGAGGEI